MIIYGLIGKSLVHSFSQKYFTKKFEKMRIDDCKYHLFEIENITHLVPLLESNKEIMGLNVTIPYKEDIIPYLDSLDESAKRAGAVNVIKFSSGKWKGYNSDVYGFQQSLSQWMGTNRPNALVLGTGGASKAVGIALDNLNIQFQLVSRQPKEGVISYDEVNSRNMLDDYLLVINTTPLGMYPSTDKCPVIDYSRLGAKHFLYDLVYNPEQTLFMKKGKQQGASVKNGLEMLHLQAEKSWEIWRG